MAMARTDGEITTSSWRGKTKQERKAERKEKRQKELQERYAKLGIDEQVLRAYNLGNDSAATSLCPATFTCDPEIMGGQETDLMCERANRHDGPHRYTFQFKDGPEVYIWPEMPDEFAPEDYLRRKYSSWI